MLCRGECWLRLAAASSLDQRRQAGVSREEVRGKEREVSLSLSLSGVRQEDWGTEVGGECACRDSRSLSPGQVEWRDQVGACVSDEQT